MGKESAARMQALRDRDYEEYLRLARHAKDARLHTLLDKTDAIMADLGVKVRALRPETQSKPLKCRVHIPAHAACRITTVLADLGFMRP